MYTNWHVVPEEPVKKCMWKYVKSKFIIPREGKKWVMDGIRDAWRRHKTTIKKKYFDKYDNIEDMLENRPKDIPEMELKKLIAYWSLPTVQSMCRVNSENRKTQKWRHRMEPINFGRVRVELSKSSENNNEPTQSNLFVATRTGRKGKELDSETEIVIAKHRDRQNSGETADEAFHAVFGKEKSGRVWCFGRTVTRSSLKKEKEINKTKEQHAKEKESWETKYNETNEKVQGLQDLLKMFLHQSNPDLDIDEALASLRAKQSVPIDGNSARDPIGLSSTSTHIPNHD